MRPSLLLRAVACSLVLAPASHADLNDWLAEVTNGAPTTYVGTNLTVPTEVDIGNVTGTTGITYEFIVNGTDAGPSSALMGIRNSPPSDDSAFKFEQWPDTGELGITQAGVADHSLGSHLTNQDMHVVFRVDRTTGTTDVYVDGQWQASAPYGPLMTGTVGIGHWYSTAGNHVDPFVGDVLGVAVYDQLLSSIEILDRADAFHATGLGTPICNPAVPNSTGLPATIRATGSLDAAANNLTLDASNLPPNQFGIFMAAPFTGLVNNPGGSMGVLCLSNVGMFSSSNQIRFSGAAGSFQLQLDLNALPTPSATTAVQPGDTWYFQAWYRDWVSTGPTTNFTDAVELIFQ